uniref:Uncharacterized protein n=1 Tax=Myripristis murdjan TaxID=586833 RepID=A0A668AC55_9TELE
LPFLVIMSYETFFSAYEGGKLISATWTYEQPPTGFHDVILRHLEPAPVCALLCPLTQPLDADRSKSFITSTWTNDQPSHYGFMEICTGILHLFTF